MTYTHTHTIFLLPSLSPLSFSPSLSFNLASPHSLRFSLSPHPLQLCLPSSSGYQLWGESSGRNYWRSRHRYSRTATHTRIWTGHWSSIRTSTTSFTPACPLPAWRRAYWRCGGTTQSSYTPSPTPMWSMPSTPSIWGLYICWWRCMSWCWWVTVITYCHLWNSDWAPVIYTELTVL